MAGKPYLCIVVPASHPKTGLPCIYSAVLEGGKELGAVRFTFPLPDLLTLEADWSKLLCNALNHMEAACWVDLILADPSEIHDFPYWSA